MKIIVVRKGRTFKFENISSAKRWTKTNDPLTPAYIYRVKKDGQRVLLWIWQLDPKDWHYGIFAKKLLKDELNPVVFKRRST